MPHYTSTAAIKDKLPAKFIVQCLDDDKNGEIDADVEEQCLTGVDTQIDGYLGGRFSVPFAAPFPAIVSHAAMIFYIETLYQRRGLASDKVTWVTQAEDLRKKLDRIGQGREPLAPEIERARPSGKAITEPSKTFSATGRSAF